MRSSAQLRVSTEQALRQRIAELEEELRQAKAALVPAEILPREWGLQGVHHRILIALYHAPGGFLRHDALFRAMSVWSTETEPAQLNSQYVFWLRRKVKRFGIEILARTGMGYELPPASRAIIRAALEGMKSDGAHDRFIGADGFYGAGRQAGGKRGLGLLHDRPKDRGWQ